MVQSLFSARSDWECQDLQMNLGNWRWSWPPERRWIFEAGVDCQEDFEQFRMILTASKTLSYWEWSCLPGRTWAVESDFNDQKDPCCPIWFWSSEKPWFVQDGPNVLETIGLRKRSQFPEKLRNMRVALVIRKHLGRGELAKLSKPDVIIRNISNNRALSVLPLHSPATRFFFM